MASSHPARAGSATRGRAPTLRKGAATSSVGSNEVDTCRPGSSSEPKAACSSSAHSGLSRSDEMRQDTSSQAWARSCVDSSRGTVPSTATVTRRSGWVPPMIDDELTDPGVDEDLTDLADGVGPHAEHGTQLLGEERGHRVHGDLDTEPTGERHLADGRPQTPVGAVVVGRNQPTRTQLTHGVDQSDKPRAGRPGRARRRRRHPRPARASNRRAGCAPAPRSMRTRAESGCSCGVRVPRTSGSAAKAETTSDTGEVT